MLDSTLESLSTNRSLQVGLLIGLAATLALIVGRLAPVLLNFTLNRLALSNVRGFYDKVFWPQRSLVGIVAGLSIFELAFLIFPQIPWNSKYEIPFTLTFTVCLGLLAFRLFRGYFDFYLLTAAAQGDPKISGDFLILAKFFGNCLIVIGLVIIFGQTHRFNVFGLVASLGIGGIGVAFAAQKTLEQFWGGIVIYLDRPFSVDDYVGLPDGVYGRVESIGLRSTKIRTSGKGTLAIVPNNTMIQLMVENFTEARKVMAIVNLNFLQRILEEEQAFISQIILESTNDIFGLDSQSTNVKFIQLLDENKTQTQITFFILGSNDMSMEIRHQLLDIANQNMTQCLKEYGIPFEIQDPTVYVNSPITI